VGVGVATAPFAVLDRDSKNDFLEAAGVGEGLAFCSWGFLSWARAVEAARRIDPSANSVFKMLLLSFPRCYRDLTGGGEAIAFKGMGPLERASPVTARRTMPAWPR
jgi:hypothetical protein